MVPSDWAIEAVASRTIATLSGGGEEPPPDTIELADKAIVLKPSALAKNRGACAVTVTFSEFPPLRLEQVSPMFVMVWRHLISGARVAVILPPDVRSERL